MNPFQSLRDCEEYVYSIQTQCPRVSGSPLVLARRSSSLAVLQGELRFSEGHRLVVREYLNADSNGVFIRRYSYEILRGQEKVTWFDSQPHPDAPDLASTHPHHRHIPPDIKHNRVPAPEISFASPNLERIVAEVDRLTHTHGAR
ncbi:MAG: hypothetical protein GW911_12870 [Armatimonadetes bacterium]|nr:hypothetical protein [Armatimonadota bacterium]NCO90410.1 hypothetical protein [Armatimonadota bacterium]NCP30281.1 hypothetical protein [Armatimonadota bacterium]NCQ29466.1 hypothetical protein [Armatimonadota bacterium]NDK12925.1 hypothetical protein [Armatimonadota bacterium]